MKFATPNEAADMLARYGVSSGQIKRGAQRGRYPHMYVGGHMMVDVDALRPILEAEQAERELIGTTELSEILGLSMNAIRRGVKEGWLPYHKNGRHHRFSLAEVQAALQRRMQEAGRVSKK